MFQGMGGFGGKSFFERIESSYLEKLIVSGENAKISAFLHIYKLQIYSKFSIGSHQFSFSTTTKITCSFSFLLPFSASSTHRNFDFLQKLDYASNLRFSFRTGSKPESWFSHGKLQFISKHACVEL